jgi:predicted transposase/invertase (TIGR01784 family)
MQLEILSNLRNLQTQIVKQISAMPITFDIKKDLRYQQGKEEGIEEGIEKGIEKGIQKGRDEEINDVIRNARKNGISINLIADILNISVNEVTLRMKKMRLL